MTEYLPVYLDIETTSLEADSGMVISVGYAIGDSEPTVMSVRSYEDEQRVIANLIDRVKNAVVVTFNGSGFDIPFLISRGLKYGLYFPRVELVDLYLWAKKYLRFQSRRFHDICLFFDIPHEEISGKEMNELFIKAISGDSGAWERITSHLIQDI
ncbi:MAG: ribonuclease H-like domain-containing protein, partial [Candidatus Bathyarchaeia archaeon]